MRASFTLALLMLAGCGSVSEEDYPAAYAEARCGWLVGCYPAVYANFDQCVNDFGSTSTGLSCTYDADAAQECVDGLGDAECATDGSMPATPEACLAVYTDCSGTSEE